MIRRPLVVVPTFNEIDNLQPIVARVLAAVDTAHVLVVDDNSPDGTGKLADELADRDDRVHVLHRAGKAGLGAAYIAGFDWGMEHTDPRFDVLVEMDADGSHPPELLPRLLGRLDAGADVVLGSRWVPGGRVVDWPKSREAISRGGNLYVRLALGMHLRDATGGFRAYRREALEAIRYASVVSEGYCFQVDLARRAVQAGFNVAEVPITFADREHGESKMSSAIMREALLKVTQWGVLHRVDQARGLLRRAR